MVSVPINVLRNCLEKVQVWIHKALSRRTMERMIIITLPVPSRAAIRKYRMIYSAVGLRVNNYVEVDNGAINWSRGKTETVRTVMLKDREMIVTIDWIVHLQSPLPCRTPDFSTENANIYRDCYNTAVPCFSNNKNWMENCEHPLTDICKSSLYWKLFGFIVFFNDSPTCSHENFISRYNQPQSNSQENEFVTVVSTLRYFDLLTAMLGTNETYRVWFLIFKNFVLITHVKWRFHRTRIAFYINIFVTVLSDMWHNLLDKLCFVELLFRVNNKVT